MEDLEVKLSIPYPLWLGDALVAPKKWQTWAIRLWYENIKFEKKIIGNLARMFRRCYGWCWEWFCIVRPVENSQNRQFQMFLVENWWFSMIFVKFHKKGCYWAHFEGWCNCRYWELRRWLWFENDAWKYGFFILVAWGCDELAVVEVAAGWKRTSLEVGRLA